MRQRGIFVSPTVKTVPPLFEGSAEHWYYTLPRHSITDWDTMANRFYRTFYTTQPLHLDARTWDEGARGGHVTLQTPQEMDVNAILNAVLDLEPFPDMRPRELFAEEVYFTPFPSRYRFPTFIIYHGHTNPLKHLRRFVRQCGATAQNDALLLKQFSLSLAGIAHEWYRTLHGMVIPTWASMEELFLREKSSYRNTPKFLRSIAENEIGRIEDVPWDPIPNEQNDVDLGETTDNDESKEVFPVNVIQFKGAARKSEPGYKLACQVQTRSQQEPPK